MLACEGDVKRRDDELIELTREVARQVARTGKTKKLHPMNSYERRLVHLTVREFAGLSSCSDGTGALKRVRISKVQNAL
jgi:spoIIIJ-associated protein